MLPTEYTRTHIAARKKKLVSLIFLFSIYSYFSRKLKKQIRRLKHSIHNTHYILRYYVQIGTTKYMPWLYLIFFPFVVENMKFFMIVVMMMHPITKPFWNLCASTIITINCCKINTAQDLLQKLLQTRLTMQGGKIFWAKNQANKGAKCLKLYWFYRLLSQISYTIGKSGCGCGCCAGAVYAEKRRKKSNFIVDCCSNAPKNLHKYVIGLGWPADKFVRMQTMLMMNEQPPWSNHTDHVYLHGVLFALTLCCRLYLFQIRRNNLAFPNKENCCICAVHRQITK